MANNLQYLILDAEMGGRELKYSLLTVSFIVTDSSFQKLGELHLYVKPDDGIYIVNGEGMRVNGIDIAKHDEIAQPYKLAKPILYNFLRYHGSTERLTPVGHGVRGDIKHIQDKLISVGSWEQFCTYHYIDTSVVLQFLRACGKMPMQVDGSLEALAKYFKIYQKAGDDAQYHTAKFDAEINTYVFQQMIELGKK
jgi:hypothetical protein